MPHFRWKCSWNEGGVFFFFEFFRLSDILNIEHLRFGQIADYLKLDYASGQENENSG